MKRARLLTVALATLGSNSVAQVPSANPGTVGFGSATYTGNESAAQTYYVRCSDGSDNDSGLSVESAWLTLGRSNTVQAHAKGHADIVIEGSCVFRNDIIQPQNGGTDATHKIRYRTDGEGVVTLRGPATGDVRDVVRIWGVDWIEFMRESATSYIEIDGEVIFGSGAGEARKGEHVLTFGHIEEGFNMDDCANITVDVHFRRIRGWSGIGNAAWPDYNYCDLLTIRASVDQLGSPWIPSEDGGDYGDLFYLVPAELANHRHLIDGGTTGRHWKRGGHATVVIYGATGALRNISFDGDWSGVATFEPGDGNRGAQFGGRNALDWHAYNVIFQRGGQPQDQPRVELTKIEGTRTSISDCVGRNSDHNVFEISNAPWSWNARGLRVSHCVFDNIPGMVISYYDYECINPPDFESPYITDPVDHRFYNLILKNVSSGADRGYADMLADIHLCPGTDWRNVTFMKGITVEDPSRDADDFTINIVGGTPAAPGNRRVAWYLKNHPNNFSNWTFTTDANLDNAPAYSADVSLANMTTEYGPVDDTVSTGTGVDLTTAVGAGTTSGTLCVADISWFEDPFFGAPFFGQHSEGFFVHLEGVGNVQYTALTREPWPQVDGCFTLAASQTWANGAAVNKKISAGGPKANPNRGVQR
jgi:hypothetical protein